MTKGYRAAILSPVVSVSMVANLHFIHLGLLDVINMIYIHSHIFIWGYYYDIIIYIILITSLCPFGVV